LDASRELTRKLLFTIVSAKIISSSINSENYVKNNHWKLSLGKRTYSISGLQSSGRFLMMLS